MSLSSLVGGNGFRISGEGGFDYSGRSVSGAGDINGDGIDDLIVGATGADGNAGFSGASYVVFGTDQGFAADLNLSTLDGNNGFKLLGEANSFNGSSVSWAGDVNGDGIDDLVIGSMLDDQNGADAGAAYVVFGTDQGFAATLNLATLNGSNGFKIPGETAGNWTGRSVSGAGDINGDGFADLVIGSSRDDANGADAGATYVVFGTDQGFAPSLNPSALTGSNGFRISGAASGDNFGYSASGAGEVNGDGFADLIIGAYGADPNGTNSGATYVVFGKTDGFAANLDLSSLDGTDGFKINGELSDDLSGFSVSDAGDINGDGVDDLLVGALRADVSGSDSGASYVIYGIQADLTREGTSGVDKLKGRSADDTLSGMGGNDGLNGFGGDDTLNGGTGRDIQKGGMGADTFVFETWDDSTRLVFDAIRDFSQAEGDTIDLSALGGLEFRGLTPFSGDAGEVRYLQGQNGTFVLADQDGDRKFDLKIILNGLHTLDADDFIL